ncbi:hypothetical protein A2U01_0072191, partial [Trifolium medium]|nr:hypothetical protein [Trifolium medium]
MLQYTVGAPVSATLIHVLVKIGENFHSKKMIQMTWCFTVYFVTPLML